MEKTNNKREAGEISRKLMRASGIADARLSDLKEAKRLTQEEEAEIEGIEMIRKKEEAQVKTLDKKEKVNEIVNELNEDVKKD